MGVEPAMNTDHTLYVTLLTSTVGTATMDTHRTLEKERRDKLILLEMVLQSHSIWTSLVPRPLPRGSRGARQLHTKCAHAKIYRIHNNSLQKIFHAFNFHGWGHPRKFFNNENFPIYGSHLRHFKWHLRCVCTNVNLVVITQSWYHN